MKNILKNAGDTKLVLQKLCPQNDVINMILEFAKIKPMRNFPGKIYFQRSFTYENYRRMKKNLWIRVKTAKWRVCKITPDNDMKSRGIGTLIVKDPFRLDDGRIQYYIKSDFNFGLEKCELPPTTDEMLGLPEDKFRSFMWKMDTTHIIPVFPVMHHELYSLHDNAQQIDLGKKESLENYLGRRNS